MKRLVLALCVAALPLAASAETRSVQQAATANANSGKPQKEEAPRGQQNAPLTLNQTDISRLTKAVEGIAASADSPDERKNAHDNLNAQRQMAEAASNTVIVASVEATITLIGVILVGITLWHTKRAADAAEGTLTKLERPHLFIESPRLAPDTRMRLTSIRAAWVGGPPGFNVEYDVMNYGRSPAILRQRSATVFIGPVLPKAPAINPNDVYVDAVAIPSEGSRKGWKAFFRGALTDELINSLREARGPAVGTPAGDKVYVFVQIRYESVSGKSDEVGAIWEYLIDIHAFVPREIENYSYRKLGS